MDRELFTWGNLITWVVSSLLLYLSISFRLYMIFHHPEKSLRGNDVLRKRNVRPEMRKGGCGESGVRLVGKHAADCG